MSIKTVAILSPGDMGHAVGRALGRHGTKVITCLDGRSHRTKDLARAAGIADVPTLEELVTNSDLILSILVPSEAVGLARRVAGALRSTGANTLYADCNAVSPGTVKEIDSIITGAGGRFIDAGIIGGPPSDNQSPRFLASGPHADLLAGLDGMGIQVRSVGEGIGKASAIKMCYAAMTKGTAALHLALLTTAHLLGVSDELRDELASSQPETLKRMESQVPRLPVTARRWVGEMEEIAATFQQAGVTPDFHLGAAEMYRLLGRTDMADETPETLDTSRTLEQTVSTLSKQIRAKQITA